MIRPLSVGRATKLFRDRYGQISGIWIWMQLFKEKWLKKGQIFSVKAWAWPSPIFLRAKTSDVEVFCQIFQHTELDATLLPEHAEYIIDAGANIGLASVFLALRYPQARIDAVEVSEDNLVLLKKNTVSYPNIRIVPKGLWWRTSQLKISNPEAEPWAYRIEEASDDDVCTIPATGVEDLLRSSGAESLDVMKIDIEGSEKELFEHQTDWLQKTKLLMIELHDRIKPGCSQSVHNALDGLTERTETNGEYKVFLLHEI